MEFLAASAPDTATGSIWVYRADGARRLADADRPSFITVGNDDRNLYAVAERPRGAITSFAIGEDMELTEIGSTATGTADPCFVETRGDWLLAASYSSGQFTVHPIDDGVAGAPSQVESCPKPADAPAAEVPHAHTIRTQPSTGLVVGTDLGGDRVSVFSFNPTTGGLELRHSTDVGSGAGPRHLEFLDGDRLVISCELTPGIVLARIGADGKLTVLDHIDVSADPGDAASEIVVVGDYAVMGVRGSDRLVAARIVQGSLELVDSAPTGGRWPRHLVPIGDEIVVAGQHSDSVDAVAFDSSTGRFGASRRLLELPAPQCILPLDS